MAKSMHTTAWNKLLRKLVEMRRDRGLTQQDLADSIQRTQSFVSKIERGERRLDVLEFCQWMQALGNDPAEVISLISKEI